MSSSEWSGWFDRNQIEPDPNLDSIIVWGKCGMPHVAINMFGCWHSYEGCYYRKDHYEYYQVDFTYWANVPEGPDAK